MTTEKQLYNRIKPMLLKSGYPARIENVVGSGMPDVIWATEEGLIYIELKIEHAGKIRVEPFQLPFLVLCLKWLPPYFYRYCVLRSKGDLSWFSGDEVLKLEQVVMHGEIYLKLK